MKPSIPQGTRDFNSDTLRKRNYIFQTIKDVFELYGFQPLETPSMENIETLLGKYGDEGDKLIYRILDSGNSFSTDFFKGLGNILQEYNEGTKQFQSAIGNPIDSPWEKPFWSINPEVIESISNDERFSKYFSNLKSEISQKALRYDLTIPFARYVAMNYGQLNFPFKRYQIQPVWRADRPQKGRYREFYQCDADIVGSNSLLNEVEFANIYIDVFKKLNIDVEIKINNRKILQSLVDSIRLSRLTLDGIARPISNKSLTETEEMIIVAIAIDKLDKIGIEKVKQELQQKGLNEPQIKTIENYLSIQGTNEEKIKQLKQLFQISNLPQDEKQKGIEELEYILKFQSEISNLQSAITIDFTLARGLNYYTGTIYEVKAKNIQMGSIGGGGRYDNLTGLFDVPNVPGVGISFGVDRIYDVMQELNLFPANTNISTQILFFNLGKEESKVAYNLMQQLRSNNISCEMYHDKAKFDKQFKYAERKNILYAVIIGNKEIEEKTCIIKNIKTGVQHTINRTEILKYSFL